MKGIRVGKTLVAMTALAAGAITLAAVAVRTELAVAETSPKVIEIAAKKFDFTPNEITLKKGQPVILRLSTADRVHGFMSKQLKFDTDIAVGRTTDVAITPDTVGDYTIVCDHYCGTGHGGMKMQISVVE